MLDFYVKVFEFNEEIVCTYFTNDDVHKELGKSLNTISSLFSSYMVFPSK